LGRAGERGICFFGLGIFPRKTARQAPGAENADHEETTVSFKKFDDGIALGVPGAHGKYPHDHRHRNAGPRRTEQITYPQVVAFVAKARELGLDSMARTLILQFEFSMRRRDVIGEYVRDDDGKPMWRDGLTWVTSTPRESSGAIFPKPERPPRQPPFTPSPIIPWSKKCQSARRPKNASARWSSAI
jgi:hypothetical protein